MLSRLRALIKEADPGVAEEWKWRGTPVWSHNGLVCTGETYKNVVKMTFAKGASLKDPSGVFNSSLEGNTRRGIDFHEGDKLDEAALKALIRAAVALNKSSARQREVPDPRESVIPWLLDSDPSICWQVMRDIRGASDEAVARERARVAAEGWGSRLLDRQRPDGKWGDGVSVPHWQSTLCTLVLLRDMGLDPTSERARGAVELVREQVTWGPEFEDSPFFEGEVEPCINGRVLALGVYFGRTSGRLLDQLLGEQLADGGWNCEAERGSVRSSFHTTICVLEGLLAYEKARGVTAALTAARVRAQEYLLERRMFRRLSTGEAIMDRKGNHDWTRFAFPPTWHYDVLRGLDYLRAAGVEPDERVAEAVGLVIHRRNQDGRWPLHDHHPDPVQLDMEGGTEQPSRWNTLRALRVLDWYSARD